MSFGCWNRPNLSVNPVQTAMPTATIDASRSCQFGLPSEVVLAHPAIPGIGTGQPIAKFVPVQASDPANLVEQEVEAHLLDRWRPDSHVDGKHGGGKGGGGSQQHNNSCNGTYHGKGHHGMLIFHELRPPFASPRTPLAYISAAAVVKGN